MKKLFIFLIGFFALNIYFFVVGTISFLVFIYVTLLAFAGAFIEGRLRQIFLYALPLVLLLLVPVAGIMFAGPYNFAPFVLLVFSLHTAIAVTVIWIFSWLGRVFFEYSIRKGSAKRAIVILGILTGVLFSINFIDFLRSEKSLYGSSPRLGQVEYDAISREFGDDPLQFLSSSRRSAVMLDACKKKFFSPAMVWNCAHFSDPSDPVAGFDSAKLERERIVSIGESLGSTPSDQQISDTCGKAPEVVRDECFTTYANTVDHCLHVVEISPKILCMRRLALKKNDPSICNNIGLETNERYYCIQDVAR